MNELQGMIDRGTLARLAGTGEIDTVVAGFTDLYGRLLGKRFEVGYFLDHVAQQGAHACDYLLTADMEMEPVPGYQFANWEKGYGDVQLVADLTTLRRASWLERTALVLCDVVHGPDEEPVRVAPRSILRGQIEALERDGFTAKAASELEYYLLRESYRDAAANGYRDLPAAGWYLEDYHLLQGARAEDYHGAARRHLAQSGVPVESTKGEWGRGQHELNVRYGNVLEMADRHTVQKQCMKELADQMGLSVTFMAKYDAAQAGSSCHMHVSLWQEDRNAFAGDQALGPVSCSQAFRHFLGGWIEHLPELIVLSAPTVNSYKRFLAGSWAPTRLAWSHDNRTAGFRVVGRDQSLRIECRVPGADCNPYLAFAAILASGRDGLARKIEPPEPFVGDAYRADTTAALPKTLRAATDLFEQSSFAREVFSEDVVEHYVHFYRTEQAAYDQAVTDWERRRYFERI